MRARQAQCQHFQIAFSSVPAAALAQPHLPQPQLQLQHLLQHLHQLQAQLQAQQLGNAPTMTQGLEIVAMTAATARTPVVGLESCAKDHRQVTTVHPTVREKVKTWPLHAWTGPLAATQ